MDSARPWQFALGLSLSTLFVSTACLLSSTFASSPYTTLILPRPSLFYRLFPFLLRPNTLRIPYPANMSKQDLPVVLHNEQRGLLSIEDGKLDVLQLTADGRRKCLVKKELTPSTEATVVVSHTPGTPRTTCSSRGGPVTATGAVRSRTEGFQLACAEPAKDPRPCRAYTLFRLGAMGRHAHGRGISDYTAISTRSVVSEPCRWQGQGAIDCQGESPAPS